MGPGPHPWRWSAITIVTIATEIIDTGYSENYAARLSAVDLSCPTDINIKKAINTESA